jgi:ethylbenzene hydroxylase subunit beta/complex iron-sulfur molybdoenzyme family reductase subunit beta
MENRDGHPYKLVHEWKVALPLRPDFGTEPNVFYVPPMAPPAFDAHGDFDAENPRIPRDYLRGLFGPDVDGALETLEQERAKAAGGQHSELMDLLISRDWNDLMGPFTQNPAELDRLPMVP